MAVNVRLWSAKSGAAGCDHFTITSHGRHFCGYRDVAVYSVDGNLVSLKCCNWMPCVAPAGNLINYKVSSLFFRMLSLRNGTVCSGFEKGMMCNCQENIYSSYAQLRSWKICRCLMVSKDFRAVEDLKIAVPSVYLRKKGGCSFNAWYATLYGFLFCWCCRKQYWMLFKIQFRI